MNYAKKLISDRLDNECRYVADAMYEVKGANLRKVIALAYRDGMEAAASSLGLTPTQRRPGDPS